MNRMSPFLWSSCVITFMSMELLSPSMLSDRLVLSMILFPCIMYGASIPADSVRLGSLISPESVMGCTILTGRLKNDVSSLFSANLKL